jgi:hypothetical protein
VFDRRLASELPQYDEPADVADAQGATIIRYDTATLREELRTVIPGRRSWRVPGRAFARPLVNGLLISPEDPTRFVVAAFGVVAFDGSAAAPLAFDDPAEEWARLGGSTLLASVYGYELHGWDGDSIRLLHSPVFGGGEDLVAPFVADGLSFDQRTAGIAFGDGQGNGVMPSRDDRFTATTLVMPARGIVLDKSTGAVLSSWENRPTGIGGGADVLFFVNPTTRCDAVGTELVCLFGDTLTHVDPSTLAVKTADTLQNDLRDLAGATYVSNNGTFQRVGDGAYVTSVNPQPYSPFEAALTFPIYRLRL